MGDFDPVEQTTNGLKEILDVVGATLGAGRTVLATAGKTVGSGVTHSGQATTEIIAILEKHMKELQEELEEHADSIVDSVGAAAAEVVPGGAGR